MPGHFGGDVVMFLLDKWYCDVVTDQGSGAILYAARLRWGPFRVGYAAFLCLADGTAPREQATRRHVVLPERDGDVATWSNRSLHIEGRWWRDAPPVERRLAEGPDGTIEWMCHMPRARASVHIGDAQLAGLGYVERLRLSIPPWKLPFRTLRWGRYLSSRHWLVWIDWDGSHSRRWAWLDGVEQPGAAFSADGLVGLDDDRQLVHEEGRDIRDQPVLATLRGPLPALARRLAGALERSHEHKRLAHGSILQAGRPVDRGWSVYEEVAW